jgi:hypothetical protein
MLESRRSDAYLGRILRRHRRFVPSTDTVGEDRPRPTTATPATTLQPPSSMPWHALYASSTPSLGAACAARGPVAVAVRPGRDPCAAAPRLGSAGKDRRGLIQLRVVRLDAERRRRAGAGRHRPSGGWCGIVAVGLDRLLAVDRQGGEGFASVRQGRLAVVYLHGRAWAASSSCIFHLPPTLPVSSQHLPFNPRIHQRSANTLSPYTFRKHGRLTNHRADR